MVGVGMTITNYPLHRSGISLSLIDTCKTTLKVQPRLVHQIPIQSTNLYYDHSRVMNNKSLLAVLVIFLCCFVVRTQTPIPTPIQSDDRKPPVAGVTARSAVEMPREKEQPVRIPRIDKPPVIDGKLDDEVWKQAAVLKDFYQTNPGDNSAPSYR